VHRILALYEGGCKRRDIARSARHTDVRRSTISGMQKDRIVYSTGAGRIAPSSTKPGAPRGDGIVRVRRETGGRGGKTVTAVYGVALAEAKLKDLAGELKRLCGTGGTVKDGTIEIQGDHRERIVAALEKRGYTVKLAGG
jgi:translation initiation factor 1